MKKFLSYTLCAILGFFCGLGLLITLFGGWGYLTLFRTEHEHKPRINTVILINSNLFSEVKDVPSYKALELSLGIHEIMPVSVLMKILKKALYDPKVVGLMIDTSNIKFDRISSHLLKDIITKFKQRGKSVLTYYDYADFNNYFIASQGEKVCAHPYGHLFIGGINISSMFYKELFDKIGFSMDSIRVGKSKSYIEPYTRSNFSPQVKREYNEVLRNIMSNYVKNIVEQRGLSSAQVWSLVNNRGIFNGKNALQSALVDHSTCKIKWFMFCHKYILNKLYSPQNQNKVNNTVISPLASSITEIGSDIKKDDADSNNNKDQENKTLPNSKPYSLVNILDYGIKEFVNYTKLGTKKTFVVPITHEQKQTIAARNKNKHHYKNKSGDDTSNKLAVLIKKIKRTQNPNKTDRNVARVARLYLTGSFVYDEDGNNISLPGVLRSFLQIGKDNFDALLIVVNSNGGIASVGFDVLSVLNEIKANGVKVYCLSQ